MEMKHAVNLFSSPDFDNPVLIVNWADDTGHLGQTVFDHLNSSINGSNFGDIEPVNFFRLGGVQVSGAVARFPFSKLYSGNRKDLALFFTNTPQLEHYEFLSHLLDTCQYFLKAKEIFTINSSTSQVAHTSSRRLLAVFNQPDLQRKLRGYQFENLDWEGSPAFDSYLIWLGKKRNIPAVSLWPEVAFYLSSTGDPRAAKTVLSFFNRYLDLEIDFSGLDRQIEERDKKLASLRKENAQIDNFIRTLEMDIGLNENEQMTLAKTVDDYLNQN